MTPNPHDPELYDILKEFVDDGLKILEESKSELKFKTQEPTYKVPEGDRIGYFFTKDYGLMYFVAKNLEKLRGLSSYKKFVVKCESEKLPYIFPQYSSDFLEYYIGLTHDFEFDEKIFNDIYIELEEFLFTKNRRYRCLCLLQNFDCDTDEIDLGRGVKIKRIHGSDVHRIKDELAPTDTIGRPQDIKFTLEATIEVNADDEWVIGDPPDGIAKTEQRFKSIVTALRLFKEGDIRIPLEHLEVPLTWGVHGGWSVHYSLFPPFFSIGEKYTLDELKIEEFKSFLADFESTRFPTGIEIAIRRFNYLYERKNPEDNLIDCTIGFEALYLHRANQELGYKLAMRSARLLEEKDLEKRKTAFTFIKKAYTERSKIVHGSKKQTKTIDLGDGNTISTKDFIFVMEMYLRRSIRLFIDLSRKYSMEEISKLLDEKILFDK